jgi:hypothetical protein
MIEHLNHHINITTSVTNIKRLGTKEPMVENNKCIGSGLGQAYQGAQNMHFG